MGDRLQVGFEGQLGIRKDTLELMLPGFPLLCLHLAKCSSDPLASIESLQENRASRAFVKLDLCVQLGPNLPKLPLQLFIPQVLNIHFV